jgi:predicted enzyme related to lactoylglutathione lyase
MNIRFAGARRLLSRGLCTILVPAACAATALAAPFEIPPLVEPASSEHHVGKVVWADLATPDLGASKRFYSGMFGWTFRDIHSGKTDYSIALLDGRPVGGLVHRSVPATEPQRPSWLTFIAVRDVDAAKRTALEHGATIVAEPRTYPKRGRQAVIADPEGAVFAVLASSSGDPADDLAAPGEWIWSSLMARDPDAEAGFYQTLIGYDVFDLPDDGSLEHLVLSTDEYARASVNALPGTSTRRHPHWLSFVRVADAVAGAARAVELGGRVLVQPHLDRHGSKVAVVADPAGAHLGLMEWSDADGQKEPK